MTSHSYQGSDGNRSHLFTGTIRPRRRVAANAGRFGYEPAPRAAHRSAAATDAGLAAAMAATAATARSTSFRVL